VVCKKFTAGARGGGGDIKGYQGGERKKGEGTREKKREKEPSGIEEAGKRGVRRQVLCGGGGVVMRKGGVGGISRGSGRCMSIKEKFIA